MFFRKNALVVKVLVVTSLLLFSLLCFKTDIQLAKAESDFIDNFDDGVADGWTPQLGSWSVVNEEYFVSVGIVENGISTVNEPVPSDTVIETKLRFTDNVGFRAGIVFRYTDNGHYYAFELSNEYNCCCLIKYVPSDTGYGEVVVNVDNYAIEKGITYTLKVIIQGNYFFRCFVNNFEVLSAIDETYSYGKVGLRARRADAFFDDFEISNVINPTFTFKDEFNKETLDNKWAVIDPDGGSSFDLTANPDWLRISTTQPPYRDLYTPVDTNAPRILIQEQTGDFTVETKIMANTDQEWESGGIIVWKDEMNFVRLDRACGMSNSQRILFAITENGTSWTDVTDVVLTSDLNPTYLKLTRSGNIYSAYYSADGKIWNYIDDKTFSSAEPLAVGLDVVNVYHEARTFFADFDYFKIVSVSATEPWWDSNWGYSKAVTLAERSGNNLVNFPVQMTFEHDGKTKTLGEDIRVIIDGLEIPSCVSEINSTHATVVFEVTLAAFTSKTAYVYYGNTYASKPDYSLMPLTLAEGQNGYAVVDNSVYIGWENTVWAGSGPSVTVWVDYRVDFDGNGDPQDNLDLIADYDGGIFRKGGIGRLGWHYNHHGLGDYQYCIQTPVYVDIVFMDAALRIYRHNNWVETTQADHLWMFSPSWDYAKSGLGLEQNVVDGLNLTQITPDPYYQSPWNELHISQSNPVYMALRNENAGVLIAGTGLRIGQGYEYMLAAKEGLDWDRVIKFDFNDDLMEWRNEPVDPYDQPADCRIYWYADQDSDYSGIETLAQVFNSQPLITVGDEIERSGGLVGYWKLDEGSGTTVGDSSGYGNSGNFVSSPQWTDGVIGNALDFDGIDDYVTIPDSPSLRVQSFTLATWIFMTKRPYEIGAMHPADPHVCLINKMHYVGTAAKAGYKLDFEYPTASDDTLVLTIGDGSAQRFLAQYNSINDLTLNEWHFVAGTYDGSIGKIYIDGELKASGTGSYTILHDNTPLCLSREVSQPIYDGFNGTMDEVMIYSEALNAEEIYALYDSVPTLPEPTLELFCSSSTSYSGFKVEMQGNLRSNETVISEAPILLSYSVTGGNSWQDLTMVYTAPDGSYSATWMPSVTGNYLIKATYEGDDNYLGTTKIVNLAVAPYGGDNIFSVSSNSTVTSLVFDSEHNKLKFSVSGEPGTTGYADVYIAKSLVQDPSNIKVFVDEEKLNYTIAATEDAWLLHFAYTHSTHNVVIDLETALIPEFSPWLFLVLIPTILLLKTLFMSKKKKEEGCAGDIATSWELYKFYENLSNEQDLHR